MIPRALPRLVTDALTSGWRVDLEPFLPLRDVCATFTYTPRMGGTAHGTTVVLAWAEGRIEESAINGQHTPYQQCVRLIRSPEGATS